MGATQPEHANLRQWLLDTLPKVSPFTINQVRPELIGLFLSS